MPKRSCEVALRKVFAKVAWEMWLGMFEFETAMPCLLVSFLCRCIPRGWCCTTIVCLFVCAASSSSKLLIEALVVTLFEVEGFLTWKLSAFRLDMDACTLFEVL